MRRKLTKYNKCWIHSFSFCQWYVINLASNLGIVEYHVIKKNKDLFDRDYVV